MVVRAYTGPTRQGVDDIKVALLYANKYKKLAEVRGKIILSGKYVINVVNDIPEITGYKTQSDEYGNPIPYFYVVDDPALKRKILDENESKLLGLHGIDYPALRENLLGEDGGPR
jgi:hypothetical protein